MASLTDLTRDAVSLLKCFEAQSGKGSWSRAEIFRGFVADVGALAKLTMAADGVREVPGFREKLGHELADCLWSVLILAREYDVDLESEFSGMVAGQMKKLADKE